MQASKRKKIAVDKTSAKTRHCDECQHRIWSVEFENTPKALQCAKGHAPRFYMPTSPIDRDYGWKRKCHDYEIGDHVQQLSATTDSAGCVAWME